MAVKRRKRSPYKAFGLGAAVVAAVLLACFLVGFSGLLHIGKAVPSATVQAQASTPSSAPALTPVHTLALPTPDPSGTRATPSPSPSPTVSPSPTPSPTPTPTPTATLPPSGAPSGEGRLSGLIIGVDAGHQAQGNHDKEPIAPGSDILKDKVSTGTQGRFSGVKEYIVNLQVSLILRDLLEAQGAQVVMIRQTHEVDISNAERAEIFNRAGVDLGIRIHCNGNDSPDIHGISVMVPDKQSIYDASRKAGNKIFAALLNATGAKDMGLQVTGDLTGFNWSEVPSVLVEMGFMTNEREDYLLIDPQYQQTLAQAMVEGVLAYFGR